MSIMLHQDSVFNKNETLHNIVHSLKGQCIEFKYYADGIHSGLTPPG